jgi:hypothetical protein
MKQALNFDPKLLQARWVLGRMNGEDVVRMAVMALDQGFDGRALRQLSGLNQPAVRDLGNLPDRAFAEMCLDPLDREHAISFLAARGATLTVPAVYALVQAFPDFVPRWREHLAKWGGEPAGPYNDMAEFVHFVVEDLYEKSRTDEVQRAFQVLEALFVEENQQTRDLVGLGFFETLRNLSSSKPYGNKAFEPFLGNMSRQVWQEVQRMWAGKSSLMDVIRSEQGGK